MIRYFAFLLLFSLIGCNALKEEMNSVIHYNDCIVIEQNNTAYENGFLHGSTVKKEIENRLNSWKKNMSMELGLTIDSMKSIVYHQTSFYHSIKSQTPLLLDEIYGIADGSDMDRELILYYNLGEEIYNYCNRPTERCSNLAISKDDKNILVYNQDLPLFLHGNQKPVILKHHHSLVFAMPGTIGISGVSKTVAVSCNSLPMLKMNTDGLPLSFAIRELLLKKSYLEIQQFVKNTAFAIPQNLLLASSKEVLGFEISKNSIEEYRADIESQLYHTNFPIYSTDYKTKMYKPSTCMRYQAIDSFVNEEVNQNQLEVESLMSHFSKMPLSNNETFIRFLVIYAQNKKETPKVLFFNPALSKTIRELNFKLDHHDL